MDRLPREVASVIGARARSSCGAASGPGLQSFSSGSRWCAYTLATLCSGSISPSFVQIEAFGTECAFLWGIQ
eukprot:4404514-Lingulodinium_polyedra.AAC.1